MRCHVICYGVGKEIDMKEDSLLTISNILNNKRVWRKISEHTGLWHNTNDDFFYDVEEFILTNFKRMDNERR